MEANCLQSRCATNVISAKYHERSVPFHWVVRSSQEIDYVSNVGWTSEAYAWFLVKTCKWCANKAMSQDFGWWREKNQLPSCVRLHNHHGYGTFIVIVSKTWPDVDILFLVWNGLAVKINSYGDDLQHKGVRSIPFDVDEDLCQMYRDKLVHFSAP